MDKIWLKSYPDYVPEKIDPDKFDSIAHMFLDSCEKYADRPAFTNMGVVYTYRQMEEKTRHFASYLLNVLKLQKGDRVALMMPNILQYPIAMLGILRAGLTVVSINPLYTGKELQFQLNDSGAKSIVILENFAHTLQKVINATAIQHVIVTSISEVVPFPKRLLVHAYIHYIARMVPSWSLPGKVSFTNALELGAKTDFPEVEIKNTDIAFLQYTGGTTGTSKGAILTHRNLVANVEQAFAWLSGAIHVGEEIIITALPLYHIFSLTANCFTFIRSGSLNVLITNPRDINAFVKELKKHKFTTITGVNTLFNALLNNSEFNKLDFSALRIALGGGMAVQRIVAERWQQLTKKPLLEAYGLTETSPAACMNPMELPEYNASIGLPISSTEISIRDDHDNELGIDEAGELLIRGPQVMKGYWQQDAETKKVLSDDGWLRTGDVATIDANGFVKIVDRKKDMILISGFNVYPNEIEDVIADLDGVLEVAVVGVPDSVKGELAKAFVVRKDNSITEKDIVEHCRQKLTAYKIPKLIEFRDELPKSNVGKILRRALK